MCDRFFILQFIVYNHVTNSVGVSANIQPTTVQTQDYSVLFHSAAKMLNFHVCL